MNKVLYSTHEDDFSNSEESLEDVAQQLWEEFTLEEQQECDSMILYKGKVVTPKFSDFLQGYFLLEEVSTLAYDTCGEWAIDYLKDVTDDKIKELDDLISSWVDKHNLNPKWFMVEDIGEVEFEIPRE